MLSQAWPTFVTTGTAVISLVCTIVMTWRGKPRLRVHSAIDREQLVVWVRNRGQGEGRVSTLVLGGTRNGDGGFDMTPLLSGGLVVPAGQRWRGQVALTALPPNIRAEALGGWTSVWLQAGRRRRAEVMVRGGRGGRPAPWILPPSSSKLSRLLPTLAMLVLFAAAPVADVDTTAGPDEFSPMVGWSLAGLGLLSGLVAWRAARSKWDSLRQRVQRRVVYLCMVASWFLQVQGLPDVAVVGTELVAMGSAWVLLCPGLWPRERPRALALLAAVRRGVTTISR